MIGRLFRMLETRLAVLAVLILSSGWASAAEVAAQPETMDQKIDKIFGWATGWFVNGIFVDVPVNGYPVKLVVVWLALAGLVTILPLIWFNLAARTLTLTALGFFQYIAPTLSFTLAVFVYGEAFTPGHAVAFGCIWFALFMVSFESLVRSRKIFSR